MTGFVEIGSVGWQHEQWKDSYYPDDLPSDWLFSYYSKQFRTVWLNASELINNSAEEIQSWLDDCDQHFDFLLEFPSLGDQPKNECDAMLSSWVQSAKLFGEHTLGYAIRSSENIEKVLTQLESNLQTTENEPANLFVLPGAVRGSIPDLDELKNLSRNIHEIVTPERVEQVKDSQILLVDFQSADDMRSLGKVLNAFVNQNNFHNNLYCYFDGKPPSYSLMQKAQTIVSMLDT